MGYVAVKGGSDAIAASLAAVERKRLERGLTLDLARIQAGLRPLLDQVMSEASLVDEQAAALAVKQAQGSPEEAVFFLRAHRSTLPRLHTTATLDTASMLLERRISATFKDVPGGQILGASVDYLHRLLRFELMNETDADAAHAAASILPTEAAPSPADLTAPRVSDVLRREGLLPDVPPDPTEPADVTTMSLSIPAPRSARLQVLTRGQTGTVTSLGYASLRGYGPMLHPTVGELRVGWLPVEVADPMADSDDEDERYHVGHVQATEVETFVPVHETSADGQDRLRFDIGYGFCFGQNETKAIAMSLLDRTLETPGAAAVHDEEFVLLHVDSVESSGFISHLKLPHYVTFQSELQAVRDTQREREGDAS